MKKQQQKHPEKPGAYGRGGGGRGEGVKEREQMMMRNDLIYSDTVKMK